MSYLFVVNHLTKQLVTTPKSLKQMFMPPDNGKKVITEVMSDAEAPRQGVDSGIKYHYPHSALTVRASRHGVKTGPLPRNNGRMYTTM